MADKIPQFDNEQPIISPVNIASGSQGFDEFAKMLGSLSSSATEKVGEMEEDKSQTMYINSVANAEQAKTKAEEQMLMYPGQATKVAASAQANLNTIKTGAFVNSKDRARLNAYVDDTNNDIQLKAVENNVKQGQLEAAFTHYANFPATMKAYQDALINDHAKAESMNKAMMASLHGLVATGAITPEQAGTNVKAMSELVDRAYKLQPWGYGQQDTDAKGYHTLTSTPLSQNSDESSPQNVNTQWLVDHYSGDTSFQGVMADISKRQLPSPEAIMNMTPDQNTHALLALRGAQVADGMINSGEPFPSIQTTYDKLNERGRTLSYSETATKDALGIYMKSLKDGDYMQVMGSTPQGDSILENFNQRQAAIQNLAVDDATKNAMLLDNQNKMVNDSVAYGQAHHIPSEYIQPIPKGDIASIQDGFKLGGDPTAVLTTISKYSKQNQLYAANALKNPDQKMVVQTVALSNSIPNQDKLDFITANQTGRLYLNKEFKPDTHDNTMYSRVAANLTPQMNIIKNNYDSQNAPTLQNSMIKTTMNYAKLLAQKNNDYTMQGWKGYVDQASRIYQDAFQQRSGTNWIVNGNQLTTPLSDNDMDTLAAHVTSEGYKILRSGRSEGEYESAISRNPLKMTIGIGGELQAVDGNGNIYYSQPYTNNTLALARREVQAKKDLKKRSALNSLGITLTEVPDANS